MSLRARILLLVIITSMLPMLAITWLLSVSRAETESLAQAQLAARVEAVAKDLDDKLAGTAQLQFGLARVPVLDDDDKAACSDFLAEVLKEHPQYTGILTIRPDGHLHCDSLRSGRKLVLTDRYYFQQALTSTRPVTEIVIGRLTGKAVLQIAYPVRAQDGKLRYILLASFDMDAFGGALANAPQYPNMHFQVWNRDGTLIVDYPGGGKHSASADEQDRQFMLTGANRATATLRSGDTNVIWAKADLQRWGNAGLRLAVTVPEEDIHERVAGRYRRTLVGLLAFSALVFAIAAALGVVAIRRQATRLMQAIDRMDHGDYRQPIGNPYPSGELGQVMQALDRMGGSLEEQRQEIERYTKALEYQASVDPLTNLANRNLLTDRLDQALVYAWRSNRVVGVLMLDLDRFKVVNDSLGHSQGDRLLRVVAERLTASVREGDTVARLGGDEFVVVLADMESASDIAPIAREILTALSAPVDLGIQTVTVNTSIGLAVYPSDGETADMLMQHADAAMYRAKERGGNSVAFFTGEMLQDTLRRLRIEAGLHRALEKGELRVWYQPIIDAASGRVTSAEALLRWQDPDHGLVPPIQFISIAEETGLIIPVGEWVLRQACLQAVAWRQKGVVDIPVAVNLSARQFNVPDLSERVSAVLKETGCPADLLQLEITESCIMEQMDRALESMRRLNALGISLCIDDFGTGYSSLSQLKRFPFAKLKIDREFVRDIHTDHNDRVLVEAIIALAKKLGLRTVAEGVELGDQMRFLREHACDELQGYLFSKPCPADHFERYIAERETG